MSTFVTTATPVCTATLTYRTIVPHDWIAFEFCHLDLTGPAADAKEALLDEAYRDEFDARDRAYSDKLSQRRELVDEIDELTWKYKKFSWLQSTFTKRAEYKALERTIREKRSELTTLDDEIEHSGVSVFAKELFYTSWLRNQNFQRISENVDDSNRHSETWVLYE